MEHISELRSSRAALSCLALVLVGVSACASDGADEGAQSPGKEGPAAGAPSQQGQLLAHLDLSLTHTIDIVESAPGEVSFVESGGSGEAPVVGPSSSSAAELYAHLYGDNAEPALLARLDAADARVRAHNLELTSRDDVPAPPPAEPPAAAHEKHAGWPTSGGVSVCSTDAFGGGYDSVQGFHDTANSTSTYTGKTLRSRATVADHGGPEHCPIRLMKWAWNNNNGSRTWRWDVTNMWDFPAAAAGHWNSVQTTNPYVYWNAARLLAWGVGGNCQDGGVQNFCVIEDI